MLSFILRHHRHCLQEVHLDRLAGLRNAPTVFKAILAAPDLMKVIKHPHAMVVFKLTPGAHAFFVVLGVLKHMAKLQQEAARVLPYVVAAGGSAPSDAKLPIDLPSAIDSSDSMTKGLLADHMADIKQVQDIVTCLQNTTSSMANMALPSDVACINVASTDCDHPVALPFADELAGGATFVMPSIIKLNLSNVQGPDACMIWVISDLAC